MNLAAPFGQLRDQNPRFKWGRRKRGEEARDIWITSNDAKSDAFQVSLQLLAAPPGVGSYTVQLIDQGPEPQAGLYGKATHRVWHLKFLEGFQRLRTAKQISQTNPSRAEGLAEGSDHYQI